MQIKFKLKQIRKTKNLSQSQLAKLANISIGTVVRMEQNKINDTNFITMLKIATALNISLYDLFEIY
jgi:transcriptional regulator with XRE-family HTH domain